MKLILMLVLSLGALNASAFPEATFECKNIEGLPNNSYEFKKITVDGVDLPYVTMNRYYKGPLENGVPSIRKTMLKGIAAESLSTEGVETLILGALRFEFKDGEFTNCKKP